jgi:hypothetical protein
MEDVEVPFQAAQNNFPAPPWASPSSYHSSYNSSRYSAALPVSASLRELPVTVKPASYNESSQSTAQVSARPNTEAPMTVIALKSGAAIVASEYWLQGGAVRCISASGEQKVPLEQVDLYRTTTLNRQRNVEFVLQSRDAVEQ